VALRSAIRWIAGFATIAISTASVGQTLKLAYSSYFGGSSDDSGYAIATDSAGAVYIAGFTESSDFPLSSALQPYFAGGTGDLFIAKIKSDSLGFEYIAYVAGVTRSTDFPTTPGAFQTSIGSQFACDSDPDAGLCGDGFVLKLNSSSNRLLFSSFLGGSDYDDAKAIAIDSTGSEYTTGTTIFPDFPTTDGAFQTTLYDVDAPTRRVPSPHAHAFPQRGEPP